MKLERVTRIKNLVLKLFALGSVFACAGFPQQSVSAGGHWVRTQQKDPKSGAETAAFVLEGQTKDFERHPAIALTCDGHKQPEVVYKTDVRLGRQARNTYNYYAPSIW